MLYLLFFLSPGLLLRKPKRVLQLREQRLGHGGLHVLRDQARTVPMAANEKKNTMAIKLGVINAQPSYVFCEETPHKRPPMSANGRHWKKYHGHINEES